MEHLSTGEGADAVILTCLLVYLGGWVITTGATYAAGRRVADRDMTPLDSLGFSVLAGLVWPLMIIGVVELSSVAVYSSAKSQRHDVTIPASWLSGDGPSSVVPLR